jgi:CheY-like chemotaxis protein
MAALAKLGARPMEILLIEDNAGDVRLMQEALKQGPIPAHLNVASDGLEGLDFLAKRGPFADAPDPDLILLDLNLPKTTGREVLREIKANPDWKHLPVIVMTTSTARQDVEKAYELNANCYITKPIELDEFLRVVRTIEDFWFSVATLPRH